VRPSLKKGWLNRNVLATGIVSLLSDAGHEIVTALLPLFVTLSSAMGGLGANAALLGTIEGLSDGLSSAAKPVSGHLSDRSRRRKPWMVFGYVATGVLLPAVAFVQTYIGLAVLRISSWVGRGVRGPPRDALLSDSVQPEQYGKAFGFHRAMDSIGAVIGPTLAFLLLPYLGVRHTILFAIIPGALSILVVVLFIKEAKRGLVSDKAVTFRASISSFPRNFKLLLAAQGTFGIGNFANSLFILAALQILTPSLGEMAAASASLGFYVLLNAVYALASFPVGVLADKRGKAGLLGLGYLFNALACLILAFWINSVMVIGFAFVAVGLQLAFTDTAEAALAAELLPKKVVGTGYGVLQLVDGVGDFASSFVVGLLWVIFSPVVGLVYSALLSVIAWAMILWLMRKPH